MQRWYIISITQVRYSTSYPSKQEKTILSIKFNPFIGWSVAIKCSVGSILFLWELPGGHGGCRVQQSLDVESSGDGLVFELLDQIPVGISAVHSSKTEEKVTEQFWNWGHCLLTCSGLTMKPLLWCIFSISTMYVRVKLTWFKIANDGLTHQCGSVTWCKLRVFETNQKNNYSY